VTRRSVSERKQEAARTLATRIQIGRLLIKQETKMPQGRSAMTQSAAFSTARTITTNYEHKLILKDWKAKEGAGNYKQKKSDEILQKAAKTAGLTPEDIRGTSTKRRHRSRKTGRGKQRRGAWEKTDATFPADIQNTVSTPRKITTRPKLWK